MQTEDIVDIYIGDEHVTSFVHLNYQDVAKIGTDRILITAYARHKGHISPWRAKCVKPPLHPRSSLQVNEQILSLLEEKLPKEKQIIKRIKDIDVLNAHSCTAEPLSLTYFLPDSNAGFTDHRLNAWITFTIDLNESIQPTEQDNAQVTVSEQEQPTEEKEEEKVVEEPKVPEVKVDLESVPETPNKRVRRGKKDK